MRATERSITGLQVVNDPSCYKTRREARLRIQAIYAEYEAKQNAFDRREHSDGGHEHAEVNAEMREGIESRMQRAEESGQQRGR